MWLTAVICIGQVSFSDVTNQHSISPVATSPFFGNGVAAADYDNDGDIDIYVCADRGSMDHLYENDGGIFTSVSTEVGLGTLDRSRMALWFDYDGDSDLDLLVVGDCYLDPEDCEEDLNIHLYRHDDGQFQEVSLLAGMSTLGPKRRIQRLGGLAAADIDGDTYLDIVIAMSNNPLQVLMNDGGGSFVDQSEELDLNTGEYYYWQPFFHDFNGDGNIDLYCNVDFEENQFYLNSPSIQFQEVGRLTQSDNNFNDMGITLADVDNDGDFDIYTTNIVDSKWVSDTSMDTHNVLLLQEDDLTFREVAKDLGIEAGGWGWGATFFDANNDGLIDLAATNGWSEEPEDQSKFWLQNDGFTFSDQSLSVGFDDILNATTLISFDYDRDGDLDMLQGIKGYEGDQVPMRLLSNETNSGDIGNYLVVKPRMSGNNHYAIGAVVTAYTGEIKHKRIIHAGTSFYGQEPAEAFIGLGSCNVVDSLEIRWPGGETSMFYGFGVNQIMTLMDDNVLHRPVGLHGEQVGAGIQLAWVDVSGNETGFVIHRSSSDTFIQFEIIELDPNTFRYLDSDLDGRPNYYYRLKSIGTENESRFTDPIRVRYTVLSVDSESPSVNLYPNPTNEFIHVQSSVPIELLEMHAINGAKITLPNAMLANEMMLDLTQLKNGIYLLTVNDSTHKIIVSHDQ